MTRLLITGCNGMLGRQLTLDLAPMFDCTCVDREHVDLSDADQALQIVTSAAPDFVINAAAYTDVDGCEDQEKYPDALAANTDLPANLATACKKTGTHLIHISTDYVYSGEKSVPYVETDPTAPVNAYGRSKLFGDQAMTDNGCRHLILRTAWLYGHHGRNFVEAILEKAQSLGKLSVVDDQHGSPTTTTVLSDAIRVAMEKKLTGLFHLTCQGQTTWYGFAKKICELSRMDVEIEAMGSDRLDRAARRPANSVLDCAAWIQATGHEPPDWQTALEDYLAKR